MGKVVLVTSGKGGTGKSTLAVNCGVALALQGCRTLLVDTDAGLRALDTMLGVSDRVVYDLADVLSGRCEPDMAVLSTRWAGLSLCPAPAEEEDGAAGVSTLPALCRALAATYDFVLLDSPAGLGDWMRASAASAPQALVVATADPVCVRDADRTAGLLLAQGCADLRLVINRVRPHILQKRLRGGLDAVIDAAAVRLIGVVPEDRRVTLASFVPAPVVRHADERRGAPAAFCRLAHRLRGESLPLDPY